MNSANKVLVGLPTSRVSIARDNYYLPTLSLTPCTPFFLVSGARIVLT